MASFPTLAPKSPHFFKVIVADPLAFEKLRIPKKFVRKYGKALSESVCLEVPSGMAWKVDITRNGKEVWLDNGWKQFAESFSLSPGHLLAFRYEGNSKFCVFIFDLSASEIDYKLDSVHDKDLNIPKTEESNEDDVLVENLDDFAPCTRPQKRMRSSSTTSENDDGANVLYPLASHSNDEATQSNRMNLGKSKRKLDFSVEDFAGGDMSTSHLLPQSEDPVITKSFTFGKKSRALERASAFETKNPSFEVFMQHSYIYPGFRLNIPANFVHKHFTRKNGDVKLSTSDGRTWSAKYAIKVCNQMEKAWLYSGWRAFMSDNCLKVGDACVFEMIKCDEVSFKVVIFRETLGATCPLSKPHWSIADHVKQKKRMLDLKMEKSENDASFDILDRNSPSRKRKTEGGGMCARRQQIKSKVYRSLKRLTFNENSTNLQKARAFKSENPSFMVVMRPSYIHKGFKLSVPSRFIERHFTEKNGELVLLTSDGRTWSTKYRFAVTNAKKNATLYGGWRDFVKENRLKVGDVCVFELIKGTKISLKVVIFRESNCANCPPSQDHENVTDRTKLKRKMEPDMEENVEILNGFSSRRSVKVEGGGMYARRQRLQSKAYRSIKTLTSSEKSTNLLEARAFKSENPSFMVVMQPSYIHKFNMSVPPKFIERHFTEKNGEVVLLTSDGRTWSAKYKFYATNTQKNAKLYGCWRAFVEDNRLKVGDVCVFELIKGAKISLKVVIFRESNSANCPPSQDHGNAADRAKLNKKKAILFQEPDMEANVENAVSIDIPNGFSPRRNEKVEGNCGQLTRGERPSCSSIPKALEIVGEKYLSFRAVMSSAHLHHGSVSVPLGIARKFVEFGAYTVKLQVADRFWPTKLVNYKNKSACFSKGWVGFTKQNALRLGDVCVFELIDVKDAIFKVSISRVSS